MPYIDHPWRKQNPSWRRSLVRAKKLEKGDPEPDPGPRIISPRRPAQNPETVGETDRPSPQ